MEPNIRRRFSYSYRNCALIITALNVLVFILTEAYPRLSVYLSMNTALVIRAHMYWQFVTYMFVHANLMHLIGNMLGLVFFGIAVERSLGSKEFMLMYFFTGIVSGALSFAVYFTAAMHNVFLLGASGAVFGVLLVFSVLFPRSRIYIWGILPVPAPLLVVGFALIEAANQLFGARSGVAHMTHLFGFAAAWAYIRIRMGQSPWKIWKNAYRR